MLSLCACSGKKLGRLAFTRSYRQTALESFELLMMALDSKNKEAIKEMFAEDALVQIEDFDTEIEDFLEFYEGPMISYGDMGAGCSTSSSGKNGYYCRIEGCYVVETAEGEYRIKFLQNVSAEEEAKEGIYQIGIIKESDIDEKHWQFYSDNPGFYVIE